MQLIEPSGHTRRQYQRGGTQIDDNQVGNRQRRQLREICTSIIRMEPKVFKPRKHPSTGEPKAGLVADRPRMRISGGLL